MATVKRAARRLVRLPDGTVGIRYIDLDTMQEVLDLTGYQILDGGQIPPDVGPKDNSENKKGRNQSSSEGSSDTSGWGSGRKAPYGNIKNPNSERKAPYGNIKNPNIANYLSQFPEAPNLPGQVTPAPELGGPLTVDPNFDPNNELGGPPSQPTEYGPEDGWGTPAPAGIPNVDDNRFTPGTPTVQAPTVEAPSATSPSQTVPDAPDPSRFGPAETTAQTAQQVGETYGMSSLAGYNPNYEMAPGIPDENQTTPTASPFEGVPGIPGAVGLYTAAQVNIDAGLPSFQEAIGPDLTPEGLPANPSPRETTAQGIIGDTMDVSAPSPVGARPEGVATGLPGARPSPVGMPDDSRFGGSLPSALSFQDRLSQSMQAVSPAMSMNFEPGTPAATMPGLGMGIMSPGFNEAMDAARVDAPSSVSQAMASADRFGRETMGPEQGYAKSFNESLREANNAVNSLNQVDAQGNLSSQHEMSIGGYYDPNTMANRAFSQEPSQMSPVGMASSLPDTMSVTPSRAPREDQSTAKGVISKATNKSMENVTAQDLANMSPARAATMGLISRTPAEISAMSKMMAGELHANTLKNLNSPNEEARAVARSELANVATTVENRASSMMYDGLTGPTGALTPSQYNSLMAGNMVNTNALYSKYGAAVEEALADFYSGALAPTNYDLTSYYNASLVTPNWGKMMTDTQKVGYHTFGKLPEYGPATAFKTERAALAQAYNETNRGFTPGVQASSVGIGTAGSIGSYSGAMANQGVGIGMAGSVGAFSGANKGGYSGAAGGIGSSGIGAGIAGSVGSFSGAMGGAGRGGGAGGGIGGGGYSGQAGGVGSSAGNTGVGTAGSGVGAGSRAGGGGYSGQAGGVGSSPGNTGVGTAGTGVGAGSRSSPGGGMGSTSTGSKGQRGI